MASEREVKLGTRDRDSEAVCSATGQPCQCQSGGGCVAGKPKLDPVPKAIVRHLRSARLLLDASLDHLDEAVGADYLRVRQYPAPEVREARRKVVTAIAMIDEIGGEL